MKPVKTSWVIFLRKEGLYRKLQVIDSIIYLASLKGMDSHSAEKKADELLNQTGMLSAKNKKIEELSKGMGQIIQFIVTIIHDPELIILDEAFSGLDPVNTDLLKRMVMDLRNEGKAVILSTHQMNQVEELCDRILMINNGRAVLYGNLKEIKSKFRSNSVVLDYEGDLGQISGVVEKRTHRDYMELVLDGKTTPGQVLEQLVRSGVTINRFEIATPSLNEIFLEVAVRTMNKTLLIFRHEFLKTLRRTGFIILTLALPLLALLGIGLFHIVSGIAAPPAEVTRIGYIDEIGGFNQFTTQGNITLVRFDSKDAAMQALLNKDITEYFVIPPDFVSTGTINLFTTQKGLEPPASTTAAIQSFITGNLLEGKVSADVISRVETPVNLVSTILTSTEPWRRSKEDLPTLSFPASLVFYWRSPLCSLPLMCCRVLARKKKTA